VVNNTFSWRRLDGTSFFRPAASRQHGSLGSSVLALVPPCCWSRNNLAFRTCSPMARTAGTSVCLALLSLFVVVNLVSVLVSVVVAAVLVTSWSLARVFVCGRPLPAVALCFSPVGRSLFLSWLPAFAYRVRSVRGSFRWIVLCHRLCFALLLPAAGCLWRCVSACVAGVIAYGSFVSWSHCLWCRFVLYCFPCYLCVHIRLCGHLSFV